MTRAHGASDSELIARASRAERRHANVAGNVLREPSTLLSEVLGDLVVLANVAGVIAQYRATTSGRLQRLSSNST